MCMSCLLVVLFCVPAANAQNAARPTGYKDFDQAVGQAVEFLRKEAREDQPPGVDFLAGYALLKAGVSAKHPDVARHVAKARNFARNPIGGQERNYSAGVAAMLLAQADPVGFQPELQTLADFLIAQQGADGSWDYPQRKVGDTSQCQYAVLGLWSCKRAGINVAPQVFDRCLAWHLEKVSADGGWAYHPGRREGPGSGGSTHNMTFAAAGTLGICKLLLFPDHKPKRRPKLPGGLTPIDEHKSKTKKPHYKPVSALSEILHRIEGSAAWLSARWRKANPLNGHKLYFYYAMERAMALGDWEPDGDWYRDCGLVLLESQREDGSWVAGHGSVVGTSFAILFLVRSTKQTLAEGIGGGTLRGQKGLKWGPADPENEKPTAPSKVPDLAKLLEWIESQPDPTDVPHQDVDALTRAVLAAKPSRLREHISSLKTVLHHPQAEVRENIILAMSRSGDMRITPVLIEALRDMDIHVMLKAQHALRMVARKPRGVGVTTKLLARIEDRPSDEVADIIATWRHQSTKRWREWYIRVRPWEERDDLWEFHNE